MSSFRVVCGTCKQPPDLITNDGGPNQVVCATCGTRDNADDALRIAGQHFMHSSQAAVSDASGRDPDGRKFVKFDPKRFPLRTFKWHAEAV